MKIIKQGQSFFDKVTQFTGSFENALEAALLNDASITDDVTIGKKLNYGAISNKHVTAFFNPTNEPATALKSLQLETIQPDGIGYMIIESTFIVR